eukprot:CAMPEP_0181302608 /NCGR_PEP_ID=MMETSP1101-20121128/8088_1 /TAXON_ID=46948 /ORGANISM="Rhodomonas abbreviata, Strain Caron Lab Isolate" /LENGTH=165 /DNA_ID=CAMNT_0023408071 /DNA_START=359 /DNA_END=854 /DNA_ORIENTATION=+
MPSPGTLPKTSTCKRVEGKTKTSGENMSAAPGGQAGEQGSPPNACQTRASTPKHTSLLTPVGTQGTPGCLPQWEGGKTGFGSAGEPPQAPTDQQSPQPTPEEPASCWEHQVSNQPDALKEKQQEKKGAATIYPLGVTVWEDAAHDSSCTSNYWQQQGPPEGWNLP